MRGREATRTVMVLNFQRQIWVKRVADQDLHCLLICLHLLEASL